MGKNKVLVKVHPEGKYVVDLDKDIEISKVWRSSRAAPSHFSNQTLLSLGSGVWLHLDGK